MLNTLFKEQNYNIIEQILNFTLQTFFYFIISLFFFLLKYREVYERRKTQI